MKKYLAIGLCVSLELAGLWAYPILNNWFSDELGKTWVFLPRIGNFTGEMHIPTIVWVVFSVLVFAYGMWLGQNKKGLQDRFG